MSNFNDTSDPGKKYTKFRILVIGRANAGKTTLLKRVCNTTEEPCIYDEENNNLIDPTEDRGIHDINRPFVCASNPQFIFHDSPGFEAGYRDQVEVEDFIAKRAKAIEVNDQLHAIWYCFEPNAARLLLDSDRRFFEDGVAGNVPVIAIATKFDDLLTQVYTRELGFDKSRQAATKLLADELEVPLRSVKFPPRAYVCLEDMHYDDRDHQEQVKELIQKTADSLDNLTLKMLLEERHRAEEEEKRRKEQAKRRRAEEQRRRAEEAVNVNGWGEWQGIDIEPPKQNIPEGTGEPESDDRKEEEFEAKEEADVAKLENAEVEKCPDECEANTGDRNLKELEEPKEVPVMVDEKNEKVDQEEQENEKSRWGIPLQDGPAIMVLSQKKSRSFCCGCVVM